MSSLFSVPDKEKEYQSYMVYVLCILWTVVTAVIVSMGFFFFPDLWTRWLTFLGVSLSIAIVNLSLNHLGYTRTASWTLTIMLWLYITIPCYTSGGITSPGILSQMAVILTAGFLLGGRGGLAIGLLTIGTDFWLAYLELNGSLPVPSVIHTPLTRWITAIIPFGTILALQYYATDHLRAGLLALQREIIKREEAEKETNQTVYNLKERVKELRTLSSISQILQNEDVSLKNLFQEIVEILPMGWQYPNIAAARICFAGTDYTSNNYKPSEYRQQADVKTAKGSLLTIEILYLQAAPEMDEGPFITEERNLINMLAEMIKINLEGRERRDELKDYKYALDLGYMVSISGANQCFTYVNDNFCKTSKYSPGELLGKDYRMIMSDVHSSEYFNELNTALKKGKPYRGEFCDKAKDGTLYWVDTTVVPFLDNNGNVYQYLSINHDITERKQADDKIKENEQLLKKITAQIPSNTYMFEIEESGHSKILFINRGTDTVNHNYDFAELSEKPEIFREVLHEDDKVKFNDAMKEAYRTESNISFQYRIVVNGVTSWRWMQAVPDKDKSGKTLWYGSTSDITPLVDYVTSIEQIIFDISHVIRRPVSSMLSMSSFILEGGLTENEVREISQKLHLIAEEMDKFIHRLNDEYQQKRKNTQGKIDFSSIIDERDSLFL
jgi:PAS domain S-box-containing protein